MNPLVLGSLISAVSALLGGGASIGATASLNKANRKWQEKMVDKQHSYEEQIYNQRYSPAAQSQAMAAAGQNPFSGVQTMNVGSSSSVPTPATSSFDFSSLGQAGAALGQGFQAREAMKLQREQFNQQVTNDTRSYLLELSKLNLSEKEMKSLLAAREEEIRGMKLDNDTKEINYKMIKAFFDEGGNTYEDQSEQIKASVALAKKEYEYYDANQEQIAKRIRAEINNLSASARNTLASAKNQEYQNITDQIKAYVSRAVNFDISVLPPAAQSIISAYVGAVADGKLSAEECAKEIKNLLVKLSNTETYIQGNMSFSGGLTNVSTSQSYNANQ